MVAPAAAGLVAFTILPLVVVAAWSFTHYDLATPPRFVGADNYRFAAHDPFLGQAVRNTVWILVVGLPLQLVLAMALALLLARRSKTTAVARAAVVLPSLLPPVAAALFFGMLLDPGHGLVNRVLGDLQLPEPLWFHDPAWAKPGLVLLGLWGIGPVVVLYIAGLVRVPTVLYESAMLEGAGPWRRFRSVTLPMLAPVILFTAVIGLVGALQYFTEAYVASANLASTNESGLAGAPEGSTRFYTTWLYHEAFDLFHIGYASMLAILLAAVAALTILTMVVVSRRFDALGRRP
jgi:multiple sugar transport system permease protein